LNDLLIDLLICSLIKFMIPLDHQL